MAGRFELLARPVVEDRAGILLVAQVMEDHAGTPAVAFGRKDPVGVEPFGNEILRMAQVDELVKDPLDHGHVRRFAHDQRDPLVLNALPLARFEHVDRFPAFVQQQPIEGIGRCPPNNPAELRGVLVALFARAWIETNDETRPTRA